MTFQMQSEDTNHDIFYFDQETREYSSTQTQRLIKAGEGIPGYSTVDELPTMTANQVAVRNGDDFEGTAWIVTDDHRGDTAYAKDITTHQDFIIDNLEPLTSDYTLIERTGDNYTFNETTQVWDLDSAKVAAELAQVKTAKIAELTEACHQSIIGGINSQALGTSHNYDTRESDQSNLIAAWAKSQINTTANIKCNDPAGQLGFIKRSHTENQVRQVLADFNTHQETNSDSLTLKLIDVGNATTVSAVNLIVWP